MRTNPLPSVAELRRLFDYDAEAGILRWRHRDDRLKNWNVLYAGREAGSRDGTGYVHLNFNGKYYQAHRIIWKLETGDDPTGEIDHIDGDRTNNRWINLRAATAQQNRMNMRARGEWPKGVYRYKRDGSFRAQIKKDRRIEYLGIYRSPEAAHAAYRKRASELFGEYACCDR